VVQNRVGQSFSIVTLPLLATHTMSARTQLALHPDRGEFLHRMQLAGVGDVHCCVCWRSLTEGLLFFCFLGILCLMVWTTLDNLVTPPIDAHESATHGCVGTEVGGSGRDYAKLDEAATGRTRHSQRPLRSTQPRCFYQPNSHQRSDHSSH